LRPTNGTTGREASLAGVSDGQGAALDPPENLLKKVLWTLQNFLAPLRGEHAHNFREIQKKGTFERPYVKSSHLPDLPLKNESPLSPTAKRLKKFR